MKFKLITIFVLIILNTSLFAHGMNKKGPHGGYIKMPGAFHTELVDKGNKMFVYLIDINFKNALSNNSHVAVTYKGSKSVDTNCFKEKDYFICDKPKEKLNLFQEIIIRAVRNNISASEAVYGLPLKLD